MLTRLIPVGIQLTFINWDWKASSTNKALATKAGQPEFESPEATLSHKQ